VVSEVEFFLPPFISFVDLFVLVFSPLGGLVRVKCTMIMTPELQPPGADQLVLTTIHKK
jgi:hypothetical protein